MLARIRFGYLALLALFLGTVAFAQQPGSNPAGDVPKPAAKAPEAVPKPQLNIFHLRDLNAPELASTLKELYAGEKIRIAAHASTNTVIMRGTTEELEAIRSIVARLEAVAADAKKLKEKNATGQ